MRAEKENLTQTGQQGGPRLDEAGLRAYLSTQPDIVAVYLFGSLASGRAHPRSDVDIAALLRDGPDSVALLDRRLELMGELERFVARAPMSDREIDVVILNDAPFILQNQVLRYGRLLYEGDRAARVEFEVQAGKNYADLKPMFDFFSQVLLDEIGEGELGGRRRRRSRKVATPER